jgi:hypothetical protein
MTAPPTPPLTGDDAWASPFDRLLGPDFASPAATGGVPPIHLANPEFGTPESDVQVWDGQQGYADTCAIRCQEFVLEQFTGMPFDEAALVQEARDAGWYAPGGGTSMEDVGNLLEHHGIAVNRYEGATVFHLANELAQGHKVIVGVDSGELWGEHPILESLEDKLGIAGADHAVVVSGIDTSDPDHVQVIVSDPGTGEPAATYPLDQFVDAWRDSGCYLVATQDPAPPSVPEMVNFDYSLGHIAEVWGLPYDQFLGLADHPEDWDQALDQALAQLGLDPLGLFDDETPDPDDASSDLDDAMSDPEAGALAWHDGPQGDDHHDLVGLGHPDPADQGVDDTQAGWPA